MSENIVLMVSPHPLQSIVVNQEEVTCAKCGERYGVGVWPFCPHEGGVAFVSKQYPFTTKAFNGKEVEVTSAAHEKALCREFNVVKRDDVAWNYKEYLGYNPKTKQQEYKEGNGVGTPGCWI